MLIGTVGFEGKVTIGYAENATWNMSVLESMDNATSKPYGVEKTPESKELYNFIDEMLKKLDIRPKR